MNYFLSLFSALFAIWMLHETPYILLGTLALFISYESFMYSTDNEYDEYLKHQDKI